MEHSPSPSTDLPALLGGIRSGSDLTGLTAAQLDQLASEIREVLIRSLSVTGGHLGPNLGVVELTIALHRVFETPRDKILFDVSHQAYVHKMLSGRAGQMGGIRQFGGLSGFMKRSESPHDAYGAGHAGTALSASLGICAARDMKGEDFHVVAVAGDAAFTCGTTLEALNNVSQTTKRLITILNDNEWAIDKNVGALANYFNSLQTSEAYSWVRQKAAAFVERLGGKGAKKLALDLESSAKNLILPSVLFDKFGLRYFGPIDGHDIPLLIRTLEHLKHLDEPVLLHIVTQKGYGYQPALDNPEKFHGLGGYSINDGNTPKTDVPTFSEIFGQTLTSIAEQDERVVAITAAMPSGTKLDIFKNRFPDRLFDVGIAEEHAALFACGLATERVRPYVAIYSTFMQRCIDMIMHDAALQQLPVRFCMDRAGLSPDDGPTHHGLFDIAMIRNIPGIVFMQPKDECEFVHMLHTMNSIDDMPSVIRYPRGTGVNAPLPTQPQLIPIGEAEIEQEGNDIALVSLGTIMSLAREVRNLLESSGYSVRLVNARFIRPLDEQCVTDCARTCRVVCTLEDHVVTGGFGSCVLECLERHGLSTPVEVVGWPDRFIEHGSEQVLREKYGLSAQAIHDRILARLEPSTPIRS